MVERQGFEPCYILPARETTTPSSLAPRIIRPAGYFHFVAAFVGSVCPNRNWGV